MASQLRVPSRPGGDGRSRGVRPRRQAPPDCRSRYRHGEDAGLPGAGAALRQANHRLHGHQNAAGAAFFQGRPVPSAALRAAAQGLLHEGAQQLRLPPEDLRCREHAGAHRAGGGGGFRDHPRVGEDHRNRRPLRDQEPAGILHGVGQGGCPHRIVQRAEVPQLRPLFHHPDAPAGAGKRHHHRQPPPVLRRPFAEG